MKQGEWVVRQEFAPSPQQLGNYLKMLLMDGTGRNVRYQPHEKWVTFRDPRKPL